MSCKGCICLTGDIHHMSLKSRDQKYLKGSEVQAAIEYASIVNDYGIKVTFFATGRSLQEEENNFKKLLKFPNVELGGHTYHAFKPRLLYGGIFKRLFGSGCGPGWYQDYEIKKTINIFRDYLGVNLVSWRNHAYRYDKNTYRLLAQNGIRFISDEVGPDKLGPYKIDKLISVPINVMPDHDHIYHGDLIPEFTKNRTLKRDKFLSELYSVEKWLSIISEQITAIVQNSGVATILVHPACMKIIDEFKVFKEFCSLISSHESTFMRNLSEKLNDNTV